MKHMPNLINNIEAEAAALRSRLAQIREIKRRAKRPSLAERIAADPDLVRRRSEAAKAAARKRKNILPPMTSDQRKAYRYLRYCGVDRAAAIAAVKAHE